VRKKKHRVDGTETPTYCELFGMQYAAGDQN
jgi:hypothetical protein